MTRLLRCVVLAAALSGACVHGAPSNLSPQAQAAWQATRAVKAMDQVRDVAIAAGQTAPPLLSEGDIRTVVEWHRAALAAVEQSPNGWRPAVGASLREAMATLPPSVRAVLKPYADLVAGILKEGA